MTKKEKIGAALIGLGTIGAIGFADTLRGNTAAFLLTEGVSFAAMIVGLLLTNAKAEAETPAEIMESEQLANS